MVRGTRGFLLLRVVGVKNDGKEIWANKIECGALEYGTRQPLHPLPTLTALPPSPLLSPLLTPPDPSYPLPPPPSPTLLISSSLP